MFQRIMTVLVYVSLLGTLNGADIGNGGFENGLDGWTVKGPGVSVDAKESAFGRSSLRLSLEKPAWQRVFQSFAVKPSAAYRLEYYVKCENVVPERNVRFAGAASWISMKKNTPLRGSGGPWKLDSAPGGWKKVSYTFRTGKDDSIAAVEFQLRNASGTVWIDEVRITEISGETADKHRISLKIYPIEFMKTEPFLLSENLTGTLILSPGGPVGGLSAASAGKMILDVPDFVKVTGAVPTLSLGSGRKDDARRRLIPYLTEEIGKTEYNGTPYRRFRITFDENFTRLLNSGWYRHAVFLKAEKGSAGRSGFFYYRLHVGEESSPGGFGRLKIIPPLIHTGRPCRQFAFLLGRSPFLQAVGLEGKEENKRFWEALSEHRYSWIRGCDAPLEGFQPVITVGGVAWSVIAPLRSKIAELSKILPRNVTDAGKIGTGFSNWSKLDDKTGKVEAFYRQAAREILRRYPEAKDVVWDFEPHPYGYDEGGRKRFAQTLKLGHVPSIAEINEKYRAQWFHYMVKLHAEYANRLIRIFKEEAPGIRFWLCSDNLSASGSHVSGWCGVDVRLSDDTADGHMHMPYYTGTRFFDDVQFNIANLKKPFFPMIDPAENLISFYQQYNPAKIRQNILAAAALGAKGIGFWPNDALSADYIQAVAEGYSMVSAAEEFYVSGKRCDDEFTFEPVNAITREIRDERNKTVKLYFPDFPKVLRKTVHKFGSDYLFTCFNYHETGSVLLAVQGHEEKRLYEIPPQGVKQFRLSSPQDPAVLKKLDEFNTRTAVREFPELKKGDASLEWSADARGVPFFRLKNRVCSIGIDLLGDSGITSFPTPAGNELLSGGFLARLIFYDPLQPEVISEIHSMRIENGCPELVLKGVVGPYAGANPVPNPLLGMEIFRKFILDGNTLKVEFDFRNPSSEPMKFGFRLNNYPFPGKRFDAQVRRNVLLSGGREITASVTDNIFALRGSAGIPLFGSRRPKPWDGGPLVMSAEAGTMKDQLEFLPDSSFCGVMFWFGADSNTIELLTGETVVMPGKNAVFSYRVKVSGR